MRTSINPTRENYYEYILCYVNYLLCIYQDPNNPMNDNQSTFKFKNDKLETPDFYLGEIFNKKDLGGKEVWKMSSNDYTKPAVENVEEQLNNKGE